MTVRWSAEKIIGAIFSTKFQITISDHPAEDRAQRLHDKRGRHRAYEQWLVSNLGGLGDHIQKRLFLLAPAVEPSK